MNTCRLEKMSSLDYVKKATKQHSHVFNVYAHKLCTKEVMKGEECWHYGCAYFLPLV